MAIDNTALLAELHAIVGEIGVLQGADMAAYEEGARYGNGHARLVVRPATVEQVQAVVRLCAAQGLSLLPQGANTGMVGASTPDMSGTQIVLSLSRLRATCEVDVANRSVAVDAGVTLQELNDKLEPHGLWFPIDLGANPSIGGMIATNTGGTRLIRYGDVRTNLMALQVVLMDPPGEVVELGRALRKNNTGVDWKQMFVGASGAGAIVTQATIQVHARPTQRATALVVPASDDAVMQLLQAMERDLGDWLAAFEGISGNAMQAAIDHVPNLRNPFAPDDAPEFAILISLKPTRPPSTVIWICKKRSTAFWKTSLSRPLSTLHWAMPRSFGTCATVSAKAHAHWASRLRLMCRCRARALWSSAAKGANWSRATTRS